MIWLFKVDDNKTVEAPATFIQPTNDALTEGLIVALIVAL
jgi:hypothetical protein